MLERTAKRPAARARHGLGSPGSSRPLFDQDDVAIEPPAPGPARVFVVDASGTTTRCTSTGTLRLFRRVEAVLECPADSGYTSTGWRSVGDARGEWGRGRHQDTRCAPRRLIRFARAPYCARHRSRSDLRPPRAQDACRAKLRAKLRDAARSHGWKPSYGPLVSAAAAGRRRRSRWKRPCRRRGRGAAGGAGAARASAASRAARSIRLSARHGRGASPRARRSTRGQPPGVLCRRAGPQRRRRRSRAVRGVVGLGVGTRIDTDAPCRARRRKSGLRAHEHARGGAAPRRDRARAERGKRGRGAACITRRTGTRAAGRARRSPRTRGGP